MKTKNVEKEEARGLKSHSLFRYSCKCKNGLMQPLGSTGFVKLSISLCLFRQFPCEHMANKLTIKTTYTLEFETTGQKWSVPDECVKEFENQNWIKLGATRYGFIKLVAGAKATGVKNPSLANCGPWKALLQQRNQKSHLIPCTSTLFEQGEDGEEASGTKKRKRTAPNMATTVELDLGESFGTLTARTASKTNEDLVVLLEVAGMHNLCTYLHTSGLDLSSSSSRSYNKTGKYEGVAQKKGKNRLCPQGEDTEED